MGGKEALETYEQKREKIQEFNLTSDLFAGKVFEDLAACQELCQILMQDPELRLKNVKTQYVIRNLEHHSVQLDILTETVNGSLINVELQMYREKSPLRRTRYYTSCIDMSILDKGKEYHELPYVTILYITRGDFIGGRKGFYQIRRTAEGKTAATVELDNGVCEKYFNLKYTTGSKQINELLQYLKKSDPFYHTKEFPRIVERVNFYKVQKKGVDIMCEIADRIRQEGKNEGREEGRIEGKIEGRIEAILELLAELGKIPVRIVQQIRQETDIDVLSRWLRCAASASNLAEFESRM